MTHRNDLCQCCQKSNGTLPINNCTIFLPFVFNANNVGKPVIWYFCIKTSPSGESSAVRA